jgi:hypothetical protein
MYTTVPDEGRQDLTTAKTLQQAQGRDWRREKEHRKYRQPTGYYHYYSI